MGIGQKKSHKSKMFRDGRIVLSPAGWIKLKRWMWFTYLRIFGTVVCHICRDVIVDYMHFEPDHETPRGLGGGTRDDRFVKPSHSWCNRDKGSRRTIGSFKPCPPKGGTESGEVLNLEP